MLKKNELCSIILTRFPINGMMCIRTDDEDYKFSSFSFAESQNCVNDLKNQPKLFTESLSNNNYCFVYNPKALELMIYDWSVVRGSFTSMTMILHSYLAWFLEFSRSSEENNLDVLLNVLNITLATATEIVSIDRQILISAFYHSFCMLVSTKSLFSISKYNEIIRNVFLMNTWIPQEAFDMLSKYAIRIFSKKSHPFQESVYETLSLVIELMKVIGKKFPINTALSFLPYLFDQINGFEELALNFLFDVAKFATKDQISPFIETLTNSVFNGIKENHLLYVRGEFLYISSQYRQSHSFEMKEYSSFSNEIDLTNSVCLPKPLEYDQIIPHSLFININTFCKVLIKSKQVCKDVMNSIKERSKNSDLINSAMFSYVYSYILMSVSSVYKDFSAIDVLLNSIVFDPSNSFFSQSNETYAIINTIRQTVFDILVSNSVVCYAKIFQYCSKYPLLLAECCHRTLSSQINFDFNSKNIEIVSQVTMEIVGSYQAYMSNNTDEINTINKARLALFLLIHHLCINETILIQFFECQLFSHSYLHLIFEKPIRSFALSILQRYLVIPSSYSNHQLMSQIISIVEMVCENLHNEGYVSLGNSLLLMINYVISHTSLYQKEFSALLNPITTGLNRLVSSGESESFLLQVITFLCEIAPSNNYSSPELAAIESALVKCFAATPSQQLFIKLVQVIAGKPLATVHPSFSITQPKALRLLVSVFLNSPLLGKVFEFIAELLQYSSKNSEQAHIGGFDSFLIDTLFRWMNDKTINPTLIASALSLFMIISSFISSVSVVRHFISLFCPIEGRNIPHHHQIALKSLNAMLISAKSSPRVCIPLKNGASFDFDGLNGESFDNTFTLTMWVYSRSNEPQYKPQLLLLRDINDTKFGVFITSSNLLIVIEDNDSQCSGKADFVIPMKTWSLISVTFAIDVYREQYFVYVSMNACEYKQLFFPLVRIQKGPMKTCRIGGVTSDSKSVEIESLLGPVGIFKNMDIDKIRTVCEAGPLGILPNHLDPIVYFNILESSDSVSLKAMANNATVSIRPHSIKYSRSQSFVELLINQCGIELLLPLFGQWDLQTQEGSISSYLIENTVELFENALKLGESSQKSFTDSKGFSVLSHLLMSSNQNNITYSLYLKFYGILSHLTFSEAQAQLIKHVLTNVELWLKCDSENHVRVLKHWARSLWPSKVSILSEVCTFSWVLSILKVYYWFDPDINGISRCIDRVRGQKLNVTESRKYLMMIALQSVSYRFVDSDFVLLMSHIITSGASKPNIDLLQLLRDLINHHSSLLIKFQSTNLIALLQYLFNLRDETIVCSTIAAVIEAHHHGLLNDLSLIDHIDVILHQLTPNFVTKSMLISLIQMTSTFAPELFPICFWMAINIGNKATKHLMKKLAPQTAFSRSSNWAIWPIVGIYKADPELKNTIIKYIIKCTGKNQIIHVFPVIDVVGRSLGENPESLKHDFLVEIGHSLAKGEEVVDPDVFYSVTKLFILFRDQEDCNYYLNSLIDESPFCMKIPVKPHHSPKSNRVSGSPKKKRTKKTRHSLRPSDIEQFTQQTSNFSTELAEKALAAMSPLAQPAPAIPSFKSRRVSMLTFGTLPYDYEVKQEVEKVVISIMPGELDEKIARIASRIFDIKFGIRFSKIGSWIDIDLAEMVIGLFIRFPCLEYSDLVIVLYSLLVHFGQNVNFAAISLIRQDDEKLADAFSFLNHYIHKKANNNKNIVSGSFLFLNGISKGFNHSLYGSSLRFLKHHIKMQDQNVKKAYEIFSLISDSLISLSSNTVNDHSDAILQQFSQSSKEWTTFWQYMTMKHAPWAKSLNIRQQDRFKRDFSVCCNHCPSKLKRNYNFKDHHESSFLRDTGNQNAMKELLKNYESKLAMEYSKNAPTPLFEVVETREQTKEDIKYSVNQCIIEIPCEIIKAKGNQNGTFALLSNIILITLLNNKSKSIKLNEICSILLRTRFHRPTAIEILTIFGKCYFINFPNINSIPVLKSFKNVHLPRVVFSQSLPFKQYFESLTITTLWANRKLSTFEYLMYLNKFSGRSFNDPSQYPVMPWIISDYESNSIDLNNNRVYRDLSKPMGAIDAERLELLKERQQQFSKMGMEPYLFSSGLVCPLSVYLWLLRMEPFTSLHIDIQSGRFDHAARLFISISGAWKLSTTHQNDFRELIPEFFVQPEMLMNSNNFDLGKVDGRTVSDVILPQWAKNPYEFIYIQRKAMESDYVSQHINEWIDLIWGYKQNGENSEANDNMYLPQMYSTIWNDENLKNPTRRAETEAVLCHVGQIPPQLFDKPHIKREKLQSNNNIQCVASLKLMAHKFIASNLSSIGNQKAKLTVVDESGVLSTYHIDIKKLIVETNNRTRSKSGYDSKNSYILPKYKPTERHISIDSVFSSSFEITNQSDVKQSYKQLPINPMSSKERGFYSFLKDETLIYVEHNSRKVLKVRPSSSSSIIHHRNAITSIATDEDWLVTAVSDGTIFAYVIPDFSTPKYTIPSFASSIRCCDVHSGFHSLVCGTRDNSIILISLTNGSIVRIIEMDGHRPLSVLITKSWGFILVYTSELKEGTLKYYLSIYSINGEKIERKQIPRSISAMCSFKNDDGFDFIAYVDDIGCFFVFEAFYLQPGKCLYTSDDKIIHIHSIPSEKLVIGLSETGKAVLVPF